MTVLREVEEELPRGLVLGALQQVHGAPAVLLNQRGEVADDVSPPGQLWNKVRASGGGGVAFGPFFQ